MNGPEVLRSFLKYQDVIVLPEEDSLKPFLHFHKEKVQPPLAVAKLNAAKSLARETLVGGSESSVLSSERGDEKTRGLRPSAPQRISVSEKPSGGKRTSVAAPVASEATSVVSSPSLHVMEPKMILPAIMKNAKDASQILYALFPPIVEPLPHTREIAVQFVSTTPASREEVVALHEKLVTKLEKRYARPNGYCPIRREIYDDVFSELIRQITLEEPARGVLLQRLKDESQKTLKVHANLAQHAQHFSTRKLLFSSDGLKEMQETISDLQSEIAALEVKLYGLKQKRSKIEKKYNEEREERAKPQQDELTYWRRANQQLSLRLKAETEKAAAVTSTVVEDQG